MIRGMFPTPQTPFLPDGNIDEPSLRREVDFCIDAGANGLAALVLSAEFHLLSDKERMLITKVVIEQTHGRIPVYIGTSGVSTESAVGLSKFAENSGADGIIVMPPYAQKASTTDMIDYFDKVASSVSIPVMIQDTPPPLGTPVGPVIKDLLHRHQNVQYVKEENIPSPHSIHSMVKDLGSDVKGIFGGTGCRWMILEYQSGACGWIFACEFTDIMVDIFKDLESDNINTARTKLDTMAPLIDMELLYGVTGAKEFLRLRGILPNRLSRLAGPSMLTKIDEEEFRIQIKRIEGLFKVIR